MIKKIMLYKSLLVTSLVILSSFASAKDAVWFIDVKYNQVEVDGIELSERYSNAFKNVGGTVGNLEKSQHIVFGFGADIEVEPNFFIAPFLDIALSSNGDEDLAKVTTTRLDAKIELESDSMVLFGAKFKYKQDQYSLYVAPVYMGMGYKLKVKNVDSGGGTAAELDTNDIELSGWGFMVGAEYFVTKRVSVDFEFLAATLKDDEDDYDDSLEFYTDEDEYDAQSMSVGVNLYF